MEKVGGFVGLLALEEDDRAYEDICIWLEGEADARTIERLESEAARSS